MKVGFNRCDHPKCRRKATACYDVGPAWKNVVFAHPDDGPTLHYEVCEEHDHEYFPRGAGFVDKARSERIRAELVPS